MIVMKFGGTSVGSALAIEKVCHIIENEINKNTKNSNEHNLIIVLSAVGGVTNLLVGLIDLFKNKFILKRQYDLINEVNYKKSIDDIKNKHLEIIENLTKILENKYNRDFIEFKIKLIQFIDLKFQEMINIFESIIIIEELTKETENLILSYGEFLSSKIVFDYINVNFSSSQLIDITQYIVVNNLEGNSSDEIDSILFKNSIELSKHISTNKILITQGFIARNSKNQITNLGRGGSDYSAALIAEEFNATELQIWTDVSGIKTGDPRIIQNTQTITEIDFESVNLMAYWGAKVLHPKTILPTIKNNIPTKILNTFDLGLVFTNVTKNEGISYKLKSSIIVKNNVTLCYNSFFLGNVNYLFLKQFENKYVYLFENINKQIILEIDTSIVFEDIYLITITNFLENKFNIIFDLLNQFISQNNRNQIIKLFEYDSFNRLLIIGLDLNSINYDKLINLANDIHNNILD